MIRKFKIKAVHKYNSSCYSINVKATLIIMLFFSINAFSQNWQWAKQGWSAYIDQLNDFCIDPIGNIYSIGDFGVFNTSWDLFHFDSDSIFRVGVNQLFLVKFNSSGVVQWLKDIGGDNPDGSQPFYESAHNVIYDSVSDCIYISGTIYGTAIFDNITLTGFNKDFIAKLDVNGNYIWAKLTGQYNTCLTTNVDGNLFVGGWCNDTIYLDTVSVLPGAYVAEYSSNGFCLNANKITDYTDAAIQSIKVKNKKCYVLIQTNNDTLNIDSATIISTVNRNMVIACFDSLFNINWYKFATSSEIVESCEMDLNGINDIYIAGYFKTDINFDNLSITSLDLWDMFVVKYDSSGNFIWAKHGYADSSAGASNIAVEDNGTFYISGNTNGNIFSGQCSLTSTSTDYFIARFDSSGNCIGSELIGPVSKAIIRSDNNSNCVVSGSFNTPITFGGTTLSPLNNAGHIYIAKHDAITGTEETERHSNNLLLIYANPNSGKCTITVPDDFIPEKNLTLSIFDSGGRLIQRKTLDMSGDKIKVDIEQEARGVYSVILSSSTKKYSGKIIFE